MTKAVTGRDLITNVIYKPTSNVKTLSWSIHVSKATLTSSKIELMVLTVCKTYIEGNLMSIKVLYKGPC